MPDRGQGYSWNSQTVTLRPRSEDRMHSIILLEYLSDHQTIVVGSYGPFASYGDAYNWYLEHRSELCDPHFGNRDLKISRLYTVKAPTTYVS